LLSGYGCTRIYQIVRQSVQARRRHNPRQRTPEPVKVGAINDKIGLDCGQASATLRVSLPSWCQEVPI
jgi:hypothetical protein